MMKKGKVIRGKLKELLGINRMTDFKEFVMNCKFGIADEVLREWGFDFSFVNVGTEEKPDFILKDGEGRKPSEVLSAEKFKELDKEIGLRYKAMVRNREAIIIQPEGA